MKNISKPPIQTPLIPSSTIPREWAAWFQSVYSTLDFTQLPIFADNATAKAGKLTAGNIYRTATGQLMVVF